MEDNKTQQKKTYISVLALTMMNVSIVAGIINDVQQSFYGLASVTYFAIGAICFFIPTALVAAELASGWSNRGGIFRWVGEGLGKGWGLTCLLILWFQLILNFSWNHLLSVLYINILNLIFKDKKRVIANTRSSYNYFLNIL